MTTATASGGGTSTTIWDSSSTSPGGTVANPLGVPLSGLTVYHMLPIKVNRIRVGSDWLLGALLPPQAVQTGLVTAAAVPLASASPQTSALAPPAAR
jgi:hypothetical protein